MAHQQRDTLMGLKIPEIKAAEHAAEHIAERPEGEHVPDHVLHQNALSHPRNRARRLPAWLGGTCGSSPRASMFAWPGPYCREARRVSPEISRSRRAPRQAARRAGVARSMLRVVRCAAKHLGTSLPL